MEYSFTTEQRLLHNVVLHANDIPARGLFDGQMGIVLALSEYARARRMRPLKTAINFLLNQVLDNLTTEMPLDFANGLTGIGWGVEYLIQNKFLRGQGADICAAIDQKLMQQNILRQTDLGLEKGLEGWLHYIIAHRLGARREHRQVFDKTYLQDCAHVCRSILQRGVSDPSLREVCLCYLNLMSSSHIIYGWDLEMILKNNNQLETTLLGLRYGISGQLLNKLKTKLNNEN